MFYKRFSAFMMLSQPTNNNPLPREHWLNRLRYRSLHRGCKETDLVLGKYAVDNVDILDDDSLNLFEAFLEEDDGEIWNWLVEKTPCPKPEYAALLANLRQVKLTK